MGLKKFEIMKTKWEGLWYDEEAHRYTSASFNLKALRDYKGTVRIVMFKNRFKTKGDNRPNYVFAIVPSDGDGRELEVEEFILKEAKVEVDEDGTVYQDGQRLYTYDEVRRAIRQAAYDGSNGYTDVIVRDYL